MKRILLITTLLVAAAPAYAWDYINNGPGQQIGDGASGVQNNNRAQAVAGAAARSSATAGAQSSATGGRGGAGGKGGKGGSSNVSVTNSVGGGRGGGDINGGVALTVPGGYGNAPCGGGIGLGGLGLGGGGSGGGTLWEFGDCKRMRESAALLQLGYPDAALSELCQIDRVRDAFGGTCPTTRAVMDVNADKYDYCFTRSAGDANQHRECDRIRMERR